MSNSTLRIKSKDFAKKIVVLCRDIKAHHQESVLTNQLLLSGTSIGVYLHEAQHVISARTLVPILEAAQKECHETEYWLELLFETGYIPDNQYKALQNTCGSIRRMLIASLNSARNGK